MTGRSKDEDLDCDYLTLEQAADALGTTKPTMKSWVERKINPCPCVSVGGRGEAYQFDLPAIKSWYAEELDRKKNERLKKEEAISQTQLDLEGGELTDAELMFPAKVRREYYQADVERNKALARRGELVPAAQVYREFEQTFKYVAKVLQGLPDRLQRQIGINAAQAKEVSSIIDETQGEIAKKLIEVETNYEHGEGNNQRAA